MKNQKSVSAMELSQLIDALKEDLVKSAAKRSGDFKPLFEISEAVVEATVTFERDMSVGGKIKVVVAEFGPEATEKSASLHRVSLKLIPHRPALPPSAAEEHKPQTASDGEATVEIKTPATAAELLRGPKRKSGARPPNTRRTIAPRR